LDDQYIAAGTGDKVIVRNRTSGKVVFDWKHASTVYSIAMDDQYIAAGSGDKLIVRNRTSGKVVFDWKHAGAVYSIAMDDQYIAAGSGDKLIVRNRTSGEVVFDWKHVVCVYSIAMDDQYIAAGSGDKLIVRNRTSGEVVFDWKHVVCVYSIAMDDQYIAAGTGDGDNKLIVCDWPSTPFLTEIGYPLFKEQEYLPKLLKMRFQHNVNRLLYSWETSLKDDKERRTTFFHELLLARVKGILDTKDIEKIFEFLMEHRKERGLFFLKDDEGKNALDIAVENNLFREVELLVDYICRSFKSISQYITAVEYSSTFKSLVEKHPLLLLKILDASIFETDLPEEKRWSLTKDLYQGLNISNSPEKEPIWSKKSFFGNYNWYKKIFSKSSKKEKEEVEVKALLVGFPNFLAYDGLLHQIVKNDEKHLKAFDHYVMKSGIEYKWRTYGVWIHSFLTLIYLSSWFCFIYGVIYTSHASHGWRDTSRMKLLLAFVYSIFISSMFLVIECLQYSSVSTYLSSGWNLLQVLSYSSMIVCSIMLLDRPPTYYHVNYGFISAGWTNIILGFNFLSFLRPYSWFGSLIRMLIQIFHDIIPFLFLQLVILGSFYLGWLFMDCSYDAQILSYEFIFSFYQEFLPGLLGNIGTASFEDLHDDHHDYNFGTYIALGSIAISDFIYLLFGPILTMNLLIAIMADAYDFVRENQKLYELKEKAKVVYDIDHTFFTIKYFRKDKYFPKYLHLLSWKDGDNGDKEEEKWEGHLKRLKREIQKNSLKMENNSKELKKEILEKMEKNSTGLKELKDKMENMTEKIEADSKELKEMGNDMSEMKKEITERQEHVENKLDRILELLSKPQKPD